VQYSVSLTASQRMISSGTGAVLTSISSQTLSSPIDAFD
jgi:hypothetical protein